MMNASSCQFSLNFPSKFLPGVYIAVLIVGLIANGWGLKSLFHNWKKLGNVNIFVFNLGIADMLYLLTLPFLVVYNYLGNDWIFGDVFCKITRFCFNLNLYGSIGFLTSISVYRYLAVVHPMRVMGRITQTHSVIITAMVWVLVCVQIVPDALFTKTSTRNERRKCYQTTSVDEVDGYLTYSLGRTLTGFCVPLLIILGCYGHVVAVLCTKANIDAVLKRRCLRLLFILLVLFSVCYIPYHVLMNLNLRTRILEKKGDCRGWFDRVYIAHQTSRGLVCLNSAINPLIYLHVNEGLQDRLGQSLRRVLGWRVRRRQRGVEGTSSSPTSPTREMLTTRLEVEHLTSDHF